MTDKIRTVGLLFSGGPAPAANSVISAAALNFLNAGVRVIGFYEGFRYLSKYGLEPFIKGHHYRELTYADVTDIRNEEAILLRTSRANPGKLVSSVNDLKDPRLVEPLLRVFRAFEELELDALITIGGDDTLRTANFIHLLPSYHPDVRRVSVIHLPKTIDNDYHGIDWTFGFFSAADFAAKEVRALSADVKSANGWFILEIMGRKSGWLTYAAGIAGEATKMFSVEDLAPRHLDEDGNLVMGVLADEIIELIVQREQHHKSYGIVCIAEGLADHVKEEGRHLDDFGLKLLGESQVAARLAHLVETRFKARFGRNLRIRSKQIGFETRCTSPIAFDVLLGCQLGTGAKRAVIDEGLAGMMVSVEDQLQIKFVPFQHLVDQVTGRTRVRFIDPASDFYKLARSLEFKAWQEAAGDQS
ncbi:6-phosphofructokinase [bacterium]|nr:6-phosphofructokinase [candidate division CSSED10-310 bacterium]